MAQASAHLMRTQVCRRCHERAAWTAHRRCAGAQPRAGAQPPQQPGLEALLARVASLASSGEAGEAERLCRVAAERWPSSAHAHYILGALRSAVGEHAAAEPHYRRACELAPSHAAAACNLGQTLMARGAHAEAVVHLRRAIALAPGLAEAHINLASALRAGGDAAGALAAATEAVALAPRMPQALCLLGRLALDAGDAPRALGLSQRAATAATDDVNARAAAVELGALALEASGRSEEAIGALSEAMRLRPGTAAAAAAAAQRGALAWRALRHGLQPRAADLFVASFPKAGTTWAQLIACLLCGEPAEVDVQRRAPWLEAAVATGTLSLRQLAAARAPRIFKTHAAWPHLPIAGCAAAAPPAGVRVLAVVRDPRDVCLSLYFHSRAIVAVSYRGAWAEWLDLFLAARAPLPMSGAGGGAGAGDGADGGADADADAADWFKHTLSWWRVARACPAQVHLVCYEELLAAPAAQVGAVGAFLRPERPPAPEEVARVVAASAFGQMKRRHEQGDGAAAAALRHPGEAGHFRSGAAGEWRQHCTEAQRARFGAEIRRRLAGSGLLERFPHWAET